ncbi:hypothetical protein [Pluralibacter gergoviae]|uniref:hypothetical protein n=1 Tax=Pluralibacter gergoviae TaxID=61647 RepID=UPI0006510B58|nr:hypothetical protein [Pluralibacter gergoviae]ELN2735783.1 hypothetical protein [Pluralibacter gergoviae]KMK31117.1 hypothetical protein ABW12_19165 [Pluralibacter gergoviae]
MMHTIPEEFILHSALYKNIEMKAYQTFGVISSETLASTIINFQAREQNSIVSDLYSQILRKVTR